MKKYEQIVNGILNAVGGKENIVSCFHCATRLRLQLIDDAKSDKAGLQKIEGVLGVQITAEQLQIIIGPHVGDVYLEFCELSGLPKEEAILENLDGEDKKSWKKAAARVVDVLSGSFAAVLPIIISASFIKLIAMALGPTMFHVIEAESNLYTLFTFVGDAGFYFLPIFIGYSAAKKMGVSVMLGMFIGAIMLHPTLMGAIAEGRLFDVYGIPMTLVNYSSSTIPVILIVWVMSYVEKLCNRWIPDALRMVFSPLITILVMLPIALCIVGPLGVNISSVLTNGLLALVSYGWLGAIVVSVLGGALWNVLVLCRMHLTYYMAGVAIFIENGSDPVIMLTAVAGSFGVLGMSLGAFLKWRKDKENRALICGYLIAQVFGGVTEPAIFGVGMRYTKPFIGACLGGAAGALYYSLTHTAITTMAAASNFMIFTQFLGGSQANLINGVIGGIVAAAVACAYTYLFGFREKK